MLVGGALLVVTAITRSRRADKRGAPPLDPADTSSKGTESSRDQCELGLVLVGLG